jgi:D-proline reductase (dithiol) PrdB
MTSGGLYLEGQEPFVTTNDPTYREIPRGTRQQQIQVSHHGYDVQGPLEDMNCLLPLARLADLEAEGIVGSLAETNYSFNGSVPDLTQLQEWPHAVAARMRQEEVDAVLLTPA